uniref:Uncharacterized protein n=1 Tax=Rhizophora mucronata TaxID=61149 RepID=A0A2P2Q1Q0_RHIMU
MQPFPKFSTKATSVI